MFSRPPLHTTFPIAPTTKRELNLVPLINVVFLLLIFFLLAGRIEPNQSNITLPYSQLGEEGTVQGLTITVTPSGLLLEGERTSPEAITNVLQQLYREAPETPVIVKADENVKAQDVVRLFALVKKTGGQDIVLRTRRY